MPEETQAYFVVRTLREEMLSGPGVLVLQLDCDQGEIALELPLAVVDRLIESLPHAVRGLPPRPPGGRAP